MLDLFKSLRCSGITSTTHRAKADADLKIWDPVPEEEREFRATDLRKTRWQYNGKEYFIYLDDGNGTLRFTEPPQKKEI